MPCFLRRKYSLMRTPLIAIYHYLNIKVWEKNKKMGEFIQKTVRNMLIRQKTQHWQI